MKTSGDGSLLGGIGGRVADTVMPHRHRVLGEDVLLTNDFGHWMLLSPHAYRRYLSGQVAPDEQLHGHLAERGMLSDVLDEPALVARLRRRMGYLRAGPNLHVVVVTLRCDHTCRYCHASRVPMRRPGFDMDKATAEKVVDRVFEARNRHALIEFQGGEPLANFEVVRHIVEVAREKNRTADKNLSFALVTNMTFMDEEKLAWLVANRVEICTSLDGPPDIHDAQRKTSGGGAQARVVYWIARINEAYRQAGLDTSLYRVEALLTLTRTALPQWRRIIDTYVDNGCRAIFLRPLNPFGFAKSSEDQIGYPIEDWLAMYRASLDYIIELNRQGVELLERNAAIFLTKILTPDDPNYLDIRSPCGAGIGQIAYAHDGRAYTCDEGRMVSQMGDDMFAIGDVNTDTYQDMIRSPVVRSLVLSSTLSALPGCDSCAYAPFCGVCPVTSYNEQGSLAGRVVDSFLCRKHMGILDTLFDLVRKARQDPELSAILTRWVTSRPREHFVHAGEDREARSAPASAA